jgi:ABC-type nitrate/sulfonate/bicarbonate transport system permease component
MTSREATAKLVSLLPGLIFIAAVLGAVEFASRFGFVNPVLVPGPTRVASQLMDILTVDKLLFPLGDTLRLLFIGFGLATVCGIAIGVLMGHLTPVYNLLEPLLELIRPLPKPALLPPLILFLGLGDAMKVATVFLAALFPILINTLQGVRSIEPTLVSTARTFGCSTWRILTRVVLPASAPMIFAGMKVSLGIGLVLVILSEMLSGTGGIGSEIIDMQRSFRNVEMYAWIVVLAALGITLSILFNWIERRVVFWSGNTSQ